MTTCTDSHATTGEAVLLCSRGRTLYSYTRDGRYRSPREDSSRPSPVAVRRNLTPNDSDSLRPVSKAETHSPWTESDVGAVEGVEDLLLARAAVANGRSRQGRGHHGPIQGHGPRSGGRVDDSDSEERSRIPLAIRDSPGKGRAHAAKSPPEPPTTRAPSRDSWTVGSVARKEEDGAARGGTLANGHYAAGASDTSVERPSKKSSGDTYTIGDKLKYCVYAGADYLGVSVYIVHCHGPLIDSDSHCRSPSSGTRRYDGPRRSKVRSVVLSKSWRYSPHLARDMADWKSYLNDIRGRH